MNFDIFIPVGPNDYEIVKYSLKNNKKRIESYKDILLYSEYKNFNFENTLDIDEDFFPFTKKEVHERVKNKDRSGWIYQQLVCLYYPYLQKKSEFVLVIDSDVFFTKNIKFFEENKGIFTVGTENHIPYFEHMNKLHPEITKVDNFSGISHHMLFSNTILKSMFKFIEKYHGKEFYKVYIDNLDPDETSPSADYEIYYNYALKFYPEKYKTRKLTWTNLDRFTLNNFKNFDMVSLPHWKKTRPSDFYENLKEFNFIRSLKSFNNYIYLENFFK
tara:strand:+ start:394 stop:1212 length:819 start_codon:yes stop_codon:yes gene_type:complete